MYFYFPILFGQLSIFLGEAVTHGCLWDINRCKFGPVLFFKKKKKSKYFSFSVKTGNMFTCEHPPKVFLSLRRKKEKVAM